MVKFLIIGHPRTGSTLLKELLGQHPAIKVYSELFHPVENERKNNIHGISTDEGIIYYSDYSENAIDFLNRTIWNKANLAKYQAVGFKLFAEYLQTSGTKNIFLQIQQAVPDVRVIHLVRENLLDVWISRKLAEVSGVWSIKVGDKRDSFDKVKSIKTDPYVLKKFMDYTTKMTEFFRDTYSGANYLEINYDDLILAPQLKVNQIFAFLGLLPNEVVIPLQKQNLRKNHEILQYYREVSDFFRHSEYERHFTYHQSVDGQESASSINGIKLDSIQIKTSGLQDYSRGFTTMPKVILMMMQKNEGTLVKYWAAFHASIFGQANIFIFDNGSDDKNTLNILEQLEAEGFKVLRSHSDRASFENKNKVFETYLHGLEYDFFMPMDCDEFIAVDLGNGLSVNQADIFSELEKFKHTESVLKIRGSYYNIPPKEAEFFFWEESKVFFPFGQYKSMDMGFHTGQAISGKPDTMTDLVHFHFQNKPFHKARLHAIQKLAGRIPKLDYESIQAYSGPGAHLKKFLIQSEEGYYNSFNTSKRVKFSILNEALLNLGLTKIDEIVLEDIHSDTYSNKYNEFLSSYPCELFRDECLTLIKQSSFTEAKAKLKEGMGQFPNFLDKYGHPFFEKELIRLLLSLQEWESAQAVINHNPDGKQKQWHLILFARAYQSAKDYVSAARWWGEVAIYDKHNPELQSWLYCNKKSFLSFAADQSQSSRDIAVVPTDYAMRSRWSELAYKLALPVADSFSKGNLREAIPQFSAPAKKEYARQVAPLEAVGRLLCGIAPWLVSEDDGSLRKDLLNKFIEGFDRISIDGADYCLNFTNKWQQPLVDSAYLCQAFSVVDEQNKTLFHRLSKQAQQKFCANLRTILSIKPFDNNWVLFSAIVEIFLAENGENLSGDHVDYALGKFSKWYLGDGFYGDGPHFAFDYYNSYVIHPMLLDVLRKCKKVFPNKKYEMFLYQHIERMNRLVTVMDRQIGEDGDFPLIGRSLSYRTGALYAIAKSLYEGVPLDVPRYKLRASMHKCIEFYLGNDSNFSDTGWLEPGVSGRQEALCEDYITNGSLYMASLAFLPLGLSPLDSFWSDVNQTRTIEDLKMENCDLIDASLERRKFLKT